MNARSLLPLTLWLLAGCIEADPSAIDQGTVLAVAPAEMAASGGVTGGLIGAAAGGVVGSQLGHGVGMALATVGGVIAGKIAGTEAEVSLANSSGLQYTVKLDRGYVVTVVQHRDSGDPVLMPGTRVELETNGYNQRVLPLAGAAKS